MRSRLPQPQRRNNRQSPFETGDLVWILEWHPPGLERVAGPFTMILIVHTASKVARKSHRILTSQLKKDSAQEPDGWWPTQKLMSDQDPLQIRLTQIHCSLCVVPITIILEADSPSLVMPLGDWRTLFLGKWSPSCYLQPTCIPLSHVWSFWKIYGVVLLWAFRTTFQEKKQRNPETGRSLLFKPVLATMVDYLFTGSGETCCLTSVGFHSRSLLDELPFSIWPETDLSHRYDGHFYQVWSSGHKWVQDLTLWQKQGGNLTTPKFKLTPVMPGPLNLHESQGEQKSKCSLRDTYAERECEKTSVVYLEMWLTTKWASLGAINHSYLPWVMLTCKPGYVLLFVLHFQTSHSGHARQQFLECSRSSSRQDSWILSTVCCLNQLDGLYCTLTELIGWPFCCNVSLEPPNSGQPGLLPSSTCGDMGEFTNWWTKTPVVLRVTLRLIFWDWTSHLAVLMLL